MMPSWMNLRKNLIARGYRQLTLLLPGRERGEGKPSGVGNPTEVALLLWLNEQGMDYISLRNQAKTVNQLTFSTERKYMATLVDSSVLNARVLYVKGAPEIVMGKCNLEESRVKQYNEQLWLTRIRLCVHWEWLIR